MKTIRLVLMAFIAPSMIVLPLLLTREAHCRPRVEEREIFAAVHELRKEITLYNLINGLYLSQDQIVQMLGLLRKVEGVRGEYEEKTISQARQVEEVLKGIRECVARDEEINGELVREFHSAKKGMENVKEEFHKKMISYQDEIKGILNENQIALIEEFRPCIIPPRDTWDSARVGQASDYTRMGERLLMKGYTRGENPPSSNVILRGSNATGGPSRTRRGQKRSGGLRISSQGPGSFRMWTSRLRREIWPGSSGGPMRRPYRAAIIGGGEIWIKWPYSSSIHSSSPFWRNA